MNSSSFSLRLLFFSILVISSIPVSQSYHWDGNKMYDLEYQGLNFDAEAASWTSSFALVTVGVKTTQCGSNTLLGGYNIMSGASYYYGMWSRTYSGLPSHNTITFQGKFYMIDSWVTAYDHFHLDFDSVNFQLWSVNSNYANYATADNCGNPAYKDLDPMTVYFTLPHTTTTLAFAFANHFTGTSDVQSMGFRDIIMTFSTESPVPSRSYCGVTPGYPLSAYPCSCGTGTTMTYSNSGVCGPCDSSCLTCNGATSSDCTSCAAGQYLSSGSCNQCDSSCKTCNGAGSSVCTTCLDGKYLDSGTCYLCDSSCLTCSGAGPSNCTSCVSGEYLENGSCNLCDSSCLTCDGAGPSKCTSCASGEYLENGSCSLCDSSCLTCNGAGPSMCTTCLAGINFNSGSCYNCDSSCQACDGAGPSKCTSCASGEYLLYGVCSPCDSTCKTCNGAGPTMCTTCLTGVNFKSGSCYNCDSSCQTCNGTGPSKCTSCTSGEYLENGSCHLCDSSCKTCNKAGNAACTACEVGQFLSNGSCYASCDDPLVKSSSGGVDYCDTPCPGQSAKTGGVCSSSCDSPWSPTTINGFAVCVSQCKDSEYFYEYDKKCYGKCESPYEIEIVDTIKICKVGVTISIAEVADIQKTTASIKTQGQFTSGGMKAASAINSNNPSSALLAGLSSMMQYIRYMKINYPPKVQMLFLVSADAPISLGFDFDIPSSIKKHLIDAPLPDCFEKYDINSNFVSNLWDFMMSLVLVLMIIFVLAILKCMTSGFTRINGIVSRVLQVLKWNFPLMMICGSSGDIFFYATLQLRSSPFTSLSSTICCIVSIVMMILVVLLLIIAFKIVKTIHRRRQNPAAQETSHWKGFEILYVGYEEKSFFSLGYMLLFILRGIIFNLTLAMLFDYPLIQCGIINVCNVVMICYILYLRPLKDLLAQVQLWINEGLINILSVSVLILGILDQTGVTREATRVGVGNVILFVIKVFNAAALVFMAIGMLVLLISLYQTWKTLRAKNIKSPLQMLRAMVFGMPKHEKINPSNESLPTEREENISFDIKNTHRKTNFIDTSSQQIFQTKILQTESQEDQESALQATNFDMSQSYFDPQRNRVSREALNKSFSRIKNLKTRRNNEVLTGSREGINEFEKRNEEDETKIWYSKLRKLKARLNNRDSKKIDLTIQTNQNGEGNF